MTASACSDRSLAISLLIGAINCVDGDPIAILRDSQNFSNVAAEISRVELASLLGRVDYIASFIVHANHGIV